MADVTLSDGREITIDLSKITWQEHLGLFDPAESDDRSDKTIAKTCGLDYKKEFCKLSVLDAKRITEAYFRVSREPLANPNSQSESSSV
jgi:hypothetical protein